MQYAIHQFAGLRSQERMVTDVPLVAAPAITAGSRELLRQQGVGYWDAGGSVYFDLPWAVYWVDRPVPAGHRRVLSNIYRGSSAQVLHALLLEPDRAWHINELADRAEVSASTVHQVVTFLEEQLWMEKEGRGPRSVRRLRLPGALLDAWADAHSLRRYEVRRFHRWARQPMELVCVTTDALDDIGIEYALTLGTGSQLVAPHATDTSRIWLLVHASSVPALDGAARAVELQPVDEGESVTVLVSRGRSPLLFRRQVEGYWVASDIQLYLDLWAWPQRGKEQARHLRAERIGF